MFRNLSNASLGRKSHTTDFGLTLGLGSVLALLLGNYDSNPDIDLALRNSLAVRRDALFQVFAIKRLILRIDMDGLNDARIGNLAHEIRLTCIYSGTPEYVHNTTRVRMMNSLSRDLVNACILETPGIRARSNQVTR
ncbi:hypothetical protein M6B38_194740 [Iris pallida]|uniref:LAGLIDADG homing endonuclease n=1 Tax=Iris pallida TaxID=29817 RepID=A0AAX6EEG3_IRIPA|nr:hypothetical protein M6B38_194740 [Iris pallida]